MHFVFFSFDRNDPKILQVSNADVNLVFLILLRMTIVSLPMPFEIVEGILTKTISNEVSIELT